MRAVTASPVSTGGNDAAPQVYIQVAQMPPTHTHYPQTLSVCLGAAQILIGVFCIIFNIVSLVFTLISNMPYGIAKVGHGFWCGAMFITTGSMGVSAGYRMTKCKIVSYNVMSIVSSVFTSALLVCGVIGAVFTSSNARYCNGQSPISDFCYQVQVVVAMESFLAAFAFIEAILFVIATTICCKHGACGNCCSDVDRPIFLPVVLQQQQQQADQPTQGVKLAYFLSSITPSIASFMEGPTAAHDHHGFTLTQSQLTPGTPLDPTAPAVSRSPSNALYPKIDDGPALYPQFDEGPALYPKIDDGPALYPKVDDGPALYPKIDEGPALHSQVDDGPIYDNYGIY